MPRAGATAVARMSPTRYGAVTAAGSPTIRPPPAPWQALKNSVPATSERGFSKRFAASLCISPDPGGDTEGGWNRDRTFWLLTFAPGTSQEPGGRIGLLLTVEGNGHREFVANRLGR